LAFFAEGEVALARIGHTHPAINTTVNNLALPTLATSAERRVVSPPIGFLHFPDRYFEKLTGSNHRQIGPQSGKSNCSLRIKDGAAIGI
jgi:hypothetical protein